jgi:hypothetical protein
LGNYNLCIIRPKTGWEWIAINLGLDAALKCDLLDMLILTGNANPDKACRRLRELNQTAIKEAGDDNPAATAIETLRIALFGKDDRWLPARRSQAQRARRRRVRAQAIRGY